MMEIIKIKDAIKNKRIEWQRHSLERMLERNISRYDVTEAILKGELIETYSETKPFPSALFLGWIKQRPMHVVISYDSLTDKIYIITAYEPSSEHFEQDFRVRRKE